MKPSMIWIQDRQSAIVERVMRVRKTKLEIAINREIKSFRERGVERSIAKISAIKYMFYQTFSHPVKPWDLLLQLLKDYRVPVFSKHKKKQYGKKRKQNKLTK